MSPEDPAREAGTGPRWESSPEAATGANPPATLATDGGDDLDDADGPGTATLAESHTRMTELLLPNDTNQLGRALGGAVLHWMDVCAAMAAMRFSNRPCVTASIGGVNFEGAIELGEVAVIEAYVFRAGRTSMDVRVDVDAEDPLADETTTAAGAVFTYVAVDDDARPTPVPELTCPTHEERELRTEARQERRAQLEAALDRLE